MAESKSQPIKGIDALGLLCVVATLVLTSGVNAVRAEDADEALMSVDPALAEAREANRAEPPAPTAAPEEPEVIILNTRGFNYGPPPGEIDPSAIRFEDEVPSTPAAPARR